MKSTESSAILIADLGYGDAGKGSIVDYLTRQKKAHTVIRYNGGAQAAHNVISPEGQHHTFAQFGSGSLIPGTRTHLSRFMITQPLALFAEERHLRSLGVQDAFERLSIERGALVTTPFQQAANRLKEIARGEGRHGSCGMGVGETMSDWLTHGADVLFAGDLGQRQTVIKKLGFLRDAKMAELEQLLPQLGHNPQADSEMKTLGDPGLIEATADLYQYFAGLVRIIATEDFEKLLKQPGCVIFEGAQGVLLDEWYGFYPYNSWSTLTFKNADSLLDEAGFEGEILKLGLIRAYATRHGAGPFVTEDKQLSTLIQDAHNGKNPWQRDFRVGYLDFVALRYALEVTGKLDGLVVTNLDRLEAFPAWKTCSAYQAPQDQPDLDTYFRREGASLSAIRVPADPTDLEKQARLSQLLTELRPIYREHEKEQGSYLEALSQALNLPLAITSYGPGAMEKTNFMKLCQEPVLL